jgi:23S rRNA (uridine2552-2'-O)-methyltransferase
MAKKKGYRSRASFKLLQINERFRVIKKGDVIVDLGAAPGGWSQVAKEISGGIVVAVDLQEIEPIDGVECIVGDFTKAEVLEKIKSRVTGADTILCDASPHLSGAKSTDQARAMDVASAALGVADELLRDGGNFVVKAFRGEMYEKFFAKVKRKFKRTKAYIPRATKKGSTESYIIGFGKMRGNI